MTHPAHDDRDLRSPGSLPPGEPAWCTTDHGAVIHPDDEDHRSEGIAVAVEVRSRHSPHTTTSTTVEIGLLRRIGEDTTWFVIEDGEGIHLEITLDSAHRIYRAIAADPRLRDALIT